MQAVLIIFPYGSRLMGRSVYLVFTNQNHFKMQLLFRILSLVRSPGYSSLDHTFTHSLSGTVRLRDAGDCIDQLFETSSCSRTVVTQLLLQSMRRILKNKTTLTLIAQTDACVSLL
jgi:hypothetical protein